MLIGALFFIVLSDFSPNAYASDLGGKIQWWWWGQPPVRQPRYYPQPRRRREPVRRKSTPKPEPEEHEESPEEKPHKSRSKESSGTMPPSRDHRTDLSGAVDLDALPENDADIPQSANPAAKSRSSRGNDVRSTQSAEKLPEPDKWAKPPQLTPIASVNGHSVIVYSDSDSLRKIAAACKTTSEEILNSNHLTANTLQEGQALLVPTPGEPIKAFEPEEQIQREVWRGIRGRHQIALTFDAGGEDDSFGDLISNLKAANAAATFFMTGEFARAYPAFVKQIEAQHYPIHNHSWSHPEFTKISDSHMEEELGKTDELIHQITGKTTRPYWRPPFGDRNKRVLARTGTFGFQAIYWTLDSLDSVGNKKDSDFIVRRVLNPPQAKGNPAAYLDGAIVLMHVGETGTAHALPEIIRQLRQMGFTLVTVDDILKP
jgi:peptidoglycan/xylan/chitin deacetylase (PgdA/CDA1 family)